MAQLALDGIADVEQCSAVAPDGTPSSTLTVNAEPVQVRYGADNLSVRIDGSMGALGHRLQWSLPPVDLRDDDELRLWLRGNRKGDGSTTCPFFLEMRLGSAAMPLSDPANQWLRYLPVSQGNAWEQVRLSLFDLAPEVRGALSLLELRCIDASASFIVYIDDVLAVREQMIADVEAALLARLHRRIAVSGKLVPAAIHAAGGRRPKVSPCILITHYDIRYVDANGANARNRRDFGRAGYALSPPSHTYQLFYRIDVFAAKRSAQTSILEFVLGTLGQRGELLVNGSPTSMESLALPQTSDANLQLGERVALFYKVSTRQEVGTAERVKAPTKVLIDADYGS
jgi:hypothetical protein